MKYYSTKNRSHLVSFKHAVFHSLPADLGLYMPERIPKLDALFLRQLEQLSLPEIGFEIAKSVVGDEIPPADLRKIVEDAFNFPVPLRFLGSSDAVLELFHGPSFAFKDFGARFMSRVMAYLGDEKRLLDVLVATSGDTGGAVALGFLGVPGTRVTILYPKGKVSSLQELQLTGHGQNIRAIEIEGTFDDCQDLVKKAFGDPELEGKLRLTSANSINIARLLPQSVYYFFAAAQLRSQGMKELVFSVPSGNFGNLAAGLLAQKMGLPVQHFVAATNANDIVPRYLEGQEFHPKASVQTISNAMDVGNPSNWARIQDMFQHERSFIKEKVSAFSFTDEQTRNGMLSLAQEHNYIACPHTAIAWLAAKVYRENHPGAYSTVTLSTAHPSKFPEVFPAELAARIPALPQHAQLGQGKRHTVPMAANYQAFKRYLLD